MVQNFLILFLSDTYEGSVHDKALADAPPYPLPAGRVLGDDLGFRGYLLSGVAQLRPFTKPTGGTLPAEQQAYNQEVAKVRIVIEHIMTSVKRCRIVKDTIRLWKDDVRDRVMEVACGLHNFRLRLNPWPERNS